jgi:hypothetical protein
MLAEARSEYDEFSRPPHVVNPLDEELVRQAPSRGVTCRLLMQVGEVDEAHRASLSRQVAAGVAVREIDSVPMKLAVFDGRQGLIALLDPVITKPTWTAVVFDHQAMGEAMKGLFEEYWRRGRS